MSEYELSLLRQRGLAARDSKASRGELRFALPPGYCWNELGQIEMDPDERVTEAIRLVFAKFMEFGSARQVLLWAIQSQTCLPVMRSGVAGTRVEWKLPAYHTVIQLLQHPMYAGAYVFGRRAQRTSVVDGRARKTFGHSKAMKDWNVLLRDHHPGYITWDQFEEHQRMISENAHMKKRASRKSARGGRALLTGLVRCGRCGRMMRVTYGMRAGHAHRYHCRGDQERAASWICIGIGGVRIDQAVAALIVEAVSPHAVEAAMLAARRANAAGDDVKRALQLELDDARYEASLAARRYEAVDPAKRLVARELEARWNAALERVAQVEERLAQLDAEAASRPKIDEAGLMALATDLQAAWNAPGTDARTKQRLTRIIIQEVVIDLDDSTNEAIVTVHWTGGRHTEVRVARTSVGRYPEDRRPGPVEVLRKLGGHWPDVDLAVTMNRMRCKAADGQSWTSVRVAELRKRLGIKPFDPTVPRVETISVEETSRRLNIYTSSVHRLIREGILPATQLMPSAPWQIPVAALDSEAVRQGVRDIMERRPAHFKARQDAEKSLKLPGF